MRMALLLSLTFPSQKPGPGGRDQREEAWLPHIPTASATDCAQHQTALHKAHAPVLHRITHEGLRGRYTGRYTGRHTGRHSLDEAKFPAPATRWFRAI